ncbi:hypothetical protein HMN09_00838000 [Mycena chlorophos]|uniref:Uncharacterized protein n=1 Tax=Mycena chlorophos TaxID=658473 RepID=A0A8H6SUW0_MYCCL|nr:hypothetical protein HMN09_00838000 [Mycena chlorophos]
MAFGTPCPAQLSSGAEFSGSTTNEFDGEGTTVCEYGPGQEIQCNYDTGSGAAESENPSDCPSSIDPQSGSHEHGNDPTTSTTTHTTTSTSTSTSTPPQTSQESDGTTTSSDSGETTRTSVATGNTAFTSTAIPTSPTLSSPISSGSGTLGSSAPAQDLHSTQSTGTGSSSATAQSSPSSSVAPPPGNLDPRSTHRVPASVIAGICVGVAVLLLLGAGCALMWCRRRRRRRDAAAAAAEGAEFFEEPEGLPADEPTAQMGELPAAAAFSASTRALLTPSPGSSSRPQKSERDGASGPGHTRESSFAFNHLADDSVVLISSPGSNALTRVLHSKLVTTNAQLNDLLSADASLSARDAAAGWSGPASLAGRRVLIVEEEAPPSYTR